MDAEKEMDSLNISSVESQKTNFNGFWTVLLLIPYYSL
jgi:hypothetical protein